MSRYSSESGSVIFYIFLAIVMFAALSFAVANMNRGGGTGANKELQMLRASEILQYARSLRTAIQTMQVDGVPEGRISFENPLRAVYANAACTTGECKVFHADGGGMSYAEPSEDWLDQASEWVFTGANDVAGIGTTAGNAASAELLVILPWIKKDLCLTLNDMLGVANPGGNPPADAGDVDYATYFTGSFTGADSIGGGDPEIEGQRAGCFQGDNDPADGTYHFFQVLLAR